MMLSNESKLNRLLTASNVEHGLISLFVCERTRIIIDYKSSPIKQDSTRSEESIDGRLRAQQLVRLAP